MTAVLIVVIVAMAVVIVLISVAALRGRDVRVSHPIAGGASRILFPFGAYGLAPRALDAALRLASAESATLVPVFLARVSLHLPLDTALPRQSKIAIPMQEAIEQRAVAFGVPVDSRIERGRSYRHALRQTIANESFDQIVIAAESSTAPGFDAEDVAWLLANAPGEIVVLRPAPADHNGRPSGQP
jgi:hypothetical protein